MKKIICYALGHKIEKIGEFAQNLPNGQSFKGIEFGCVRCGKRYKEDEPIHVSSDSTVQRFIRNRK